LENAVLPNLAAADVAASPAVQTATAAIDLPPRQAEEMAQFLGASDPRSGPAITEALIHPPDQTDREGGAAPLPELALADRPSAGHRPGIRSLRQTSWRRISRRPGRSPQRPTDQTHPPTPL